MHCSHPQMNPVFKCLTETLFYKVSRSRCWIMEEVKVAVKASPPNETETLDNITETWKGYTFDSFTPTSKVFTRVSKNKIQPELKVPRRLNCTKVGCVD